MIADLHAEAARLLISVTEHRASSGWPARREFLCSNSRRKQWLTEPKKDGSCCPRAQCSWDTVKAADPSELGQLENVGESTLLGTGHRAMPKAWMMTRSIA